MVRVSEADNYFLLTIFLFFSFFFFLFSQKASNLTSILLQDLRKERPDKVNLLVATYELESFAIKYGKVHLTAKKNATVRQDLFGESVFAIFSWIFINLHPASYWRSHLPKAFIYSLHIYSTAIRPSKKKHVSRPDFYQKKESGRALFLLLLFLTFFVISNWILS